MPVPTGSSFDAAFYLSTYKDVKTAADAAVKNGTASSVTDFAYDHWLNYGAREVRNPNAVFNTKSYLFNNADVQQAFNKPGKDALNPLTHYDLYGWTEKDGTGSDTTHKRSAATNGAFDVAYYTAANPSAISYGSPVAYFIAALRAAASATSTTTLNFAASAYAPTVAYLNFDHVYYLKQNADVAKSILGDKATVPATNAGLTQIQKGKVLYHWFNYGQVENRIAHKIGSASLDTASDFARITDPTVTAKDQAITASATSYTAAALDDTFTYTSTTTAIAAATTVTGWGGSDSTLIWDSGATVGNITVSGVANMVFSKTAGKIAPADSTASGVTTKGYSLTATTANATDMTFADATVTKLAVIHNGDYKVGNVKTVTGGNNSGMAFFNLGDSVGDLYLQGLTAGVSAATIQYDLFGYKAAPANNTVNLTLNGMKTSVADAAGNEDFTVINISSKSTTDIKTLKINVQTASSVVTVMAADGDGAGTLLTEQKISKLVIIGGDKGVNLNLKDGLGTSTFDTLDVSGFNKLGTITYTATLGSHTATVLGGSAALTYKSAHAITNGVNDLYGQTFQFGTSDMGTNKAGTLAAIKTVGTIDVTGIPAGANIVDSFNLSTKIFGFTADNWASITQSKTYLYINGGVLTDAATTSQGNADDGAATGNDSYFYTLGSDSVGIAKLSATTASVDLTFGAIAADSTKKAHAAIVVLKDSAANTNKMNIYFTEDNTKFDASHATLIGSYSEGTGTWGTGAGKIIDSNFFHVVA